MPFSQNICFHSKKDSIGYFIMGMKNLKVPNFRKHHTLVLSADFLRNASVTMSFF